MKNMIFHFPAQIKEDYISGTMIRPKRMMEAFLNIGYKVYPIIGSSEERKQAMKNIRNLIISGYKFDFLYSESANFPTMLLDKDHIPRHPFLDFAFFRFVKKYNISIGLFYRDIFWRFETYKKENVFIKRLITVPLFYYDLLNYKLYVDILFVPSQSFIRYLPTKFINPHRVYPLPPGCKIKDKSKVSQSIMGNEKKIKILYIGNIIPPEHDIMIFFKIAKLFEKQNNIEFYISCPAEAWIKWKSYYLSHIGGKIPVNMTIFHKKPDQLDDLYFNSQLFFIPINDKYTKMTSLIKLYEAIGYGIPILISVNGFSESSKLVEEEDIGWVLDLSIDKLMNFINYILENPYELEEKRKNILRIRENHTWEARAKFVAKVLTLKGEKNEKD